jgi:outer membrane receptor protein involved in Fe transport
MTLGKITETIEVRGSALIDVKDSQTAVATISKELIENMPNSQFVSDIVNLAPGVVSDSAFGSSDNGVQYQVDGVDVSDPELGTAYVFLDYGIVDEVKVMGIGAPAEYGGFTGIISNTVTKTGGNTVAGMFDSFIQPKTWNSKNTDDPDLEAEFSALYNVHFSIGGPIKRDKLWYFFGLQYYRSETQALDFPESSIYHQPRFFSKLTWQMNVNNRISAFLHLDLYNGNNRGAGYDSWGFFSGPEATRDQVSPEMAFNISYLHIFSDYTFFELKSAGFMSYYKLKPVNGYDIAQVSALDTMENLFNHYSYYHAYRNRLQLNATLSHHADDFIKGSHDFKFGVEIEANPTRTESGYPGGAWYYAYSATEPYLKYGWEGYDNRATNFRVSAFVQDNWSLGDRIKINPGVRINYYRGKLKGLGTIFKPEIAIAPRIGVTFDLFGDHTTAIKVHYGKYYENIITSYYSIFADLGDRHNYWFDYWDTNDWVEWARDLYRPDKYTMDPNLRMPYMHQYTIGIEREITSDLVISLNYIRRTNHDFIDKVNLTGQFEEEIWTDPETGTEYTIYNQTNDPDEDNYIITNPKEGDYPIVTFTNYREYNGIEVIINKRFSHNWTMLASYVYSKAKGTDQNYWGVSNTAQHGYSEFWSDPNYQINAEGRLWFDPTHMVKIQGSVNLPLGIKFSGYLNHTSGNTYEKRTRINVDQNRRLPIRLEPLGERRYDSKTNLDLRVEKTFTLSDKIKIGVMADVFNVFNDGTVTSVVKDAGDDFEDPTNLVTPRRFRLGLRVYFR